MLFHLPIVMMATLSPIAVADTIPQVDTARECRFEGGSTETFDRCMRDEAEALKQLQVEWPKVTGADRNSCVAEATGGGYASYIELLTCLEMARDLASAKSRPDNPRANPDSRPMQPGQPEQTVGVGRDQ